jgi:hypothetical protein
LGSFRLALIAQPFAVSALRGLGVKKKSEKQRENLREMKPIMALKSM